MAEPQPASGKGLRGNHRVRHSLALYRIHPAICSPHRKALIATPAILNQTLRENSSGKRSFSTSTKSAAFVSELTQNGARCGICGGLLHRNSITTDHIERKADGGGAHSGNAQVAHPYCNTTYKENGAKRGFAQADV
ncbi:HNH endonuclease signature motif containing protein [Novosphingobium resinovorum]|uniref:HNH endonuclease signature motif containing protein n=1 Tax=Novosphingobium resinovorum TaxID=158500 RepID=UPI0012EA0CD5